MQTKYIYRFENINDCICGLYSSDLFSDSGAYMNRPLPKHDELLCKNGCRIKLENVNVEEFIPDHYFFAFKNFKQLAKWIENTDNIIDLYDEGFIVRKYKVTKDNLIEGKTQVMFKKDIDYHADKLGIVELNKVIDQVVKALKPKK